MIYLFRSGIDPKIVEIREGEVVLQEVEIRFLIRKFPSSFFSLELALKWLREIEMKLAKAKAYRLLAIRSYPSDALLEKLEEKGFSKVVSEQIVGEFKTLGYIEDDSYWTNFIEREFQRGYGPKYLQWKKGAPAEKIRDLITPAMQQKKIRELAKKFPSPKKAAAALLRRGFDLDSIRKEIDIFS